MASRTDACVYLSISANNLQVCYLLSKTLLYIVHLVSGSHKETFTNSVDTKLNGRMITVRSGRDVEGSGKVKVKFTLEQATKTQRWSGGIAVIFL